MKRGRYYAMWQVALVKQLPIMGSNPSQPHILAEGRRKAEEWRKAMGGRTGFFGAITTGCMRPICTLNPNEK